MVPIKHSPALWERRQPTLSYWLFWCPACKCGHLFKTPAWKFNGDIKSPTFSPSLRRSYMSPVTKQDMTVCHLTLTDGQIYYHADCPHGMRGQTIRMVDMPADYGF